MAIKTSVDGNRVTIEESVYVLSPAGTGKFAVSDDFGAKLGFLTVRGKAVEAEDYGIAGAHPLAQIGKLWAAANLNKVEAKAGPATKGICRVATHEQPAEADLDKARAYRAWLKTQPGCKATYFVRDPATGKALSISIWETREQLAAIKDKEPPAGAAALRSTSVEVYPVVEEP
jgi:hypothetical protein